MPLSRVTSVATHQFGRPTGIFARVSSSEARAYIHEQDELPNGVIQLALTGSR